MLLVTLDHYGMFGANNHLFYANRIVVIALCWFCWFLPARGQMETSLEAITIMGRQTVGWPHNFIVKLSGLHIRPFLLAGYQLLTTSCIL